MLRLIERRLVLMVGLVSALPVLVSAGHAIATGWTPVFDDAIVTVRAFDVLSSHSPLVGQYSDASLPDARPVYNAGPLLFWLLALPTRLPGNWALPLTMGIVNTASIVGAVSLAHRRGGRVLMFATALALIAMCRSLPDGTLHTVVNPWSAILPLTLLLFLAWSVACGEHALLPLTALVASFAAQAHFSLVVPTICALAVAVVGLTRSLLSRCRNARGARRSSLAALAVVLVCWSAPLIDQALHHPGNLVHIFQTTTGDEQRFGMPGGWHAPVKAVGILPWWLDPPQWTEPLSISELTVRPSALALASALLAVGALAAAALLGLRRKRPDVTAAASLALLLVGAVVLSTMSTPSRLSFSILKGLGWASPAGMFAWLALGWSLAVLLQPAARRALHGFRAVGAMRAASAPAVGLGVTALTGLLVALEGDSDRFQWAFRPANAMTSHLGDARLPESGPLSVRAEFSSPFIAFRFHTAIVYQLRRQGYRVVVPTVEYFSLADKLGTYYSAANHPPQNTLYLDQSTEPVSRPGDRLLARVPLGDAPADISPRVSTMSVAPELACPPPTTSPNSLATPRSLRIVPGRLSGSVDASQTIGRNVQVCGWAGVRDKRAAALVALVANGHIIHVVRPAISRPDVARAVGIKGDAGFSVSVPLDRLQQGGRKATLRVYGIEGRAATPLPFLCSSKAQDFGC